jgi:hypothetical protein
MSALPRRAAWLALAAGIVGGGLAFLLAAAPPPGRPAAHYELIAIPWHTRTRLSVVEHKRIAPGVAEILTRRDSRTGTTFTRRRIDCVRREATLLGEGRTEAAAHASLTAAAAAGAIAENTIPFYIAAWVCERADR